MDDPCANDYLGPAAACQAHTVAESIVKVSEVVLVRGSWWVLEEDFALVQDDFERKCHGRGKF